LEDALQRMGDSTALRRAWAGALAAASVAPAATIAELNPTAW